MSEIVEKSTNVSIEDHKVPLLMEFEHSLDRHVAVAVRDEPVGVFVKQRFEDRSQEPSQHFLGHSITYGGNSQRACFRRTGTFGNVDSPKRNGTERAVLEFSHQLVQVVIQVLLEHLDADFVDPCGPPVALHSAERFEHHLGSNSPGQ